MIASSPTMPARLDLIASRTFWLCRAWSIGPLRCKDQSWRESVVVKCMGDPLTVQQRPDVFQELVGAQVAVLLLLDHAVHDVVDAPQLLRVRGLGRRRDLDDVPQVGEELLLDGLAQSLVGGVVEPLPAPRQAGETDQDLLAEGLLGVLGHPDL